MPKTETTEPQGREFNSFESEPQRSLAVNSPKKPKSLKKPDLIKPCLLCDSQVKIKYIYPKKQYSQKNNWGYWTQKAENKQKYLCNSCLMKLHRGNMRDWIPSLDRADNFYQYVWQGNFGNK